jgi:anti-anti-sigma regulatory factor
MDAEDLAGDARRQRVRISQASLAARDEARGMRALAREQVNAARRMAPPEERRRPPAEAVRIADQIASRQIAIVGALEGALLDELRERLRASAKVPLLLVDLRHCDRISVAALTVLVSSRRSREAEGQRLCAYAANERVRGTFELFARATDGLLFGTELEALAEQAG